MERSSKTFLPIFFLAAATISLAVWASAQDKKNWPVPENTKKIKNPVPVAEAGLAVARDLYLDNCAQCHGEKGKGDGPEAAMYGVKPADLTDARVMNELTDGEIFYKMSEGREPMPAFRKSLSEEKRWQLVNLLRTFAPKTDASAKKPGNSQMH